MWSPAPAPLAHRDFPLATETDPFTARTRMSEREAMEAFARRASSPEGLAWLRDKYETLLSLRSARRDAPDQDPPRAALRRLAQTFPGALRELELRSDEDLRERLRGLSLEAGSAVPPWAPPQVVFHGTLRIALALKRVMANADDPEARARQHLASIAPTIDAPPVILWDKLHLRHIANPPGGRLSRIVVGWTAEIIGLSEAEARDAILP